MEEERPHRVLIAAVGAGLLLAILAGIALASRLATFEPIAVNDATAIGERLVQRHEAGKGFPAQVQGNNETGDAARVKADGRPLAGVELSEGMAVGYYGAEGDRDFSLCIEHREGEEKGAYAIYSTGSKENGAISQSGDSGGCSAAE